MANNESEAPRSAVSPPHTFRKKPVTVIAHRIGDDGWPDEIWQGVNDKQIVLYLGRDGNKCVTGHVEIRTLEGTMRGEVGDWIIRGVKGEFYPCKPDVFEATYEAAEARRGPIPALPEIEQILTEMRLASAEVDEANGTSDYNVRLCSLALIARHLLRSLDALPPAPRPQGD